MIQTFDKIDFQYPRKLETERCAIVNLVLAGTKHDVPLGQWNQIMMKYDNWGKTPDIFVPFKPDLPNTVWDCDYLHIFWSIHFGQSIYAYAYPIIEKFKKEFNNSKESSFTKMEILLGRLFDARDYNVYIFNFT